MQFLEVMGDIVRLEVRLGVVGANWESIDSELQVRSAGRVESVSPESLEPNFESLNMRILSAMHWAESLASGSWSQLSSIVSRRLSYSCVCVIEIENVYNTHTHTQTHTRRRDR